MVEPLVYLNGQMLPASQAHLAIYDTGVVMGATVTEQTRTFRKKLFRLEDHLDRLYQSLRIARMDIGLTKHQLSAISQDLVEHNGRILEEWDDLGLVHFVTGGEYAPYAGVAGRSTSTNPTVCAHTFPLPFHLWAGKAENGTHLITPSVRQVPPQCQDPHMKCRSRMHYFLAEKEVRSADPDASALLLDLDGNVTETSAANFLMVEKGGIVSPPLAKILPGISRATVIELAGELGMRYLEREIQPHSIADADEAFLSSTGFCLAPVTKINHAPISDGKPGLVFRRLIEAWSHRAGVDIIAQIVDGARRRLI
jgi:branched-subunit amino acid aminotransferase/4-amino-4-deoxychorismate lyase